MLTINGVLFFFLSAISESVKIYWSDSMSFGLLSLLTHNLYWMKNFPFCLTVRFGAVGIVRRKWPRVSSKGGQGGGMSKRQVLMGQTIFIN